MFNKLCFSLGCGIGYGYLHRIPIRGHPEIAPPLPIKQSIPTEITSVPQINNATLSVCIKNVVHLEDYLI